MNKELRRSEDKIFGGVAAGLADYLEVDKSVVRLIWGILFFVYGVGFGAYIVAWIILPDAKSDFEKSRSELKRELREEIIEELKAENIEDIENEINEED